ncbi:sister chromatid cohesion 1 protein 4-like [Rutidosis leptorrhynchoides]|uniref:sister chromatid cohesion 1 protein 4-like n=1 Tax=Rutidosis leptorrhynchoides TaxID=125765 RepID=UPI003A99A9CB
MFYSQFILAKKGPLGTIWIAAHLERKLRKNQVADTDIGVSVDSILFPEMPIALRLSSHLLLGVVRIYSKKVNYLFDDCSEALTKVKQAFRSAAVDLPPEESTAPYHSITLPETFDLDDFEIPDSEILQGNYVDHHISSKEHITLQDTMDGVVYTTSKFGLDERFGDGDAAGLDLEQEVLVEKAANAEHTTGPSNSDNDPQASGYANDPSGVMDQQMDDDDDDDDGDSQPVDYGHAPCTPGLWEEPNLPNIQETSACDDHQEPETHTIPEFAVKQTSLENASNNESHEQPPHNQFESHEKSLPKIVATEQMLMNDLGSTPFTVSGLAHHVNSMSEPVVQTVERNHESHAEHQENQENSYHLTTKLNPGTEPVFQPNDSTFSVSMPSFGFPTLRPCNTDLNHEGKGPHANEAFVNNLPVTHFNLNNEVQLASNISNIQTHNVIQSEVQVNNINTNTSDFPAPEKLLSLPHGLSYAPRNFVPESTPAETNMSTSGKKRSFTESSLYPQSIDLNQSWGIFNTNITEQPLVNDQDLLSSILVGRNSSILKVKPTPPVSAKRRRSAPKTPKTGILKRKKAVMDDNTVLHGDIIRQQLTNTEDIRRLRKKAPCTRPEISMLEKRFFEHELFGEPVYTGVSFKLASLHNHTYDLRKIVVSHRDASLQGGPDPKLNSRSDEKDIQAEVETGNIGVSVGPYVRSENVSEDKDLSETQPTEHPLAEPFSSEYYGNQTPMHTTKVVTEPFSSEHVQGTAMDIDADVVMPIEAESLTHGNSVSSYNHDDTSAATGEVANTKQMDAMLQMGPPGYGRDINMNINSNIDIDSSMSADVNADAVIVGEASEEKRDAEIRKNEEVVNEDAPLNQNIELNNEQNMIYNGIFGEDFVTSEMNVEDIPANNRRDDEEFAHPAIENDTDFLNFDDDHDEGDDGGDDAPDVETGRVIDNSGWSSRTKAVGRYLQIMFDKEAERGKNMLSVNNLLNGKTRKEASRMFFETLVLKTKDYIHVEQADPYENINVFPRSKLLKSDF